MKVYKVCGYCVDLRPFLFEYKIIKNGWRALLRVAWEGEDGGDVE